MLYFECDYNNGCHPAVLKKLTDTNNVPQCGYGFDEFTESAVKKIKAACACPDADVFLLCGGTQTNMTVISSVLRPFEGVVAAESGHIASHEAGAVEYTGHKIITLPQKDGKLCADDLKKYLSLFNKDENREHMIKPGMVYISFPTELGTIYSKSELEAIHAVCDENNIPLYVDGARLGYGLMSNASDLTLKDFAAIADIFYIGGTKVGALCGEAVVFPKGDAPEYFFTMIKQHGALLAKGRLVGAQFDALFTDNLYFKISRNAIDKAEKLKEILKIKGYRFFLETPTNQQFVIADNKRIAELNEKMSSCFWDTYDDENTVIRFCTSWATTDEDLEKLEEIL